MDLDAVQAEEYRRRYLVHQVETATPGQRLMMLFDSFGRDLHEAREAFDVRDLKKINDHLVHAQHILHALRDPLDEQTPLGHGLRSVYGFCLDRLVDANMRKDAAPLDEVQPLIEQLAHANRQAIAAPVGELSHAG